MKRIVDEDTLKGALEVLHACAPARASWSQYFEAAAKRSKAIDSLTEALTNAPYDDLDRALEPSRAFVRGHDAGWSSAIAHTAERTRWNKGVRDNVDALLAQAGYQPDSSARHGLGMVNFDTPQQELVQAMTPTAEQIYEDAFGEGIHEGNPKAMHSCREAYFKAIRKTVELLAPECEAYFKTIQKMVEQPAPDRDGPDCEDGEDVQTPAEWTGNDPEAAFKE